MKASLGDTFTSLSLDDRPLGHDTTNVKNDSTYFTSLRLCVTLFWLKRLLKWGHGQRAHTMWPVVACAAICKSPRRNQQYIGFPPFQRPRRALFSSRRKNTVPS